MSAVDTRLRRSDRRRSGRRRSTAAALAVRRGRAGRAPDGHRLRDRADAFNAEAVQGLLAAKGRGREMPPPVLVVRRHHPRRARRSACPPRPGRWSSELWPGPLTLVCRQQPSLQWDLGDTRGTVAVRMPDHEVALAVLCAPVRWP